MTSVRALRPSTVRTPHEAPPGVTTVLDFLEMRFPRIPREEWRRRLGGGSVQCGGRPLRADTPFPPAVELQYWREVAEEPPVRTDVVIVWSDEHLLVVDKPPNLPVIPGGRYVRGCLLTVLEERLGERELAPLHRLDRDTSGLVVLSRRADSRGHFGGLFQGRTPRLEKTYLALCEVTDRAHLVSRRLGHHVCRDPTAYWRQITVAGRPPNAFADLEIVEASGGRALVQLRPLTGRKHQLRVQLAHEGLPIVGDEVYGSKGAPALDDPNGSEMALVCWRLTMTSFPRFAEPGVLSQVWTTDRRPWPETACGGSQVRA